MFFIISTLFSYHAKTLMIGQEVIRKTSHVTTATQTRLEANSSAVRHTEDLVIMVTVVSAIYTIIIILVIFSAISPQST